ncbi:hypothetical protein [uncultured Agathobaculum sp.]|uniref:hypothetical protein n=1 Tax=uncultured Agathobaculum sp. TaxID=2048140 RepID=UPI00296E7119
MKRIRQGWNTLHRHSRSGVSLIVALCAVAVLIGLSLSIVYSSSMLLSRANRKIGRERSYQLAQSFSEVLQSELLAYDTDSDALNGTFYHFVNSILDDSGIPEYDPDVSDTTYYYTTDEVENYGKLTVALRKTKNTDELNDPANFEDDFSYDERDSKTESAEKKTFYRYDLSVCVTDETGADRFDYTTQYKRCDTFEPVYIWNGEKEQNVRVYWVNGKFCRSDNGTDALTPARDKETGREEVVKIHYSYDENHITRKIYEPNPKVEGGAAGE